LTAGLLVAILLLAAGLRIPWLTTAPPGLNQDEAVNAWNAWCLIKTGHDQAGDAWPVFYYRALGGNSTTLYLWATLPFEALGGMSIFTTRLPSAVLGILTILLFYWVVARLFSRATGLVAAALLTLSPWHIELSRWGHEAIMGPLVNCVSLAGLIWAGFPLHPGPSKPIPWRAIVAGVAIGVSCYGYGSIRLFLPLFVAAVVVLCAGGWWQLIRTRRGQLAVAGLVTGVVATFGPLVYQHVAHPEGVGKHAQYPGFAVWDASDPPGVRIAKVIDRYFRHFGPDFLFINGDRTEIHSPTATGMLSWYAAPLMLAGIVPVLRGLRRSYAARIALGWLLLYPVGDILYRGGPYHDAAGHIRLSMHALRSAVGLLAPVVLAAVGAAAAGSFVWRRNRKVSLVTAVIFGLAIVILDARFLHNYFAEHPRRPAIQRAFHVDLLKALAWLKPRLDGADAVFITNRQMNMPYIISLVALGYDPQQWFRDERELITIGEWEHYHHFGKFHFLYGPDDFRAIQALQQNGRREHVIFIVRPGEVNLPDPVLTIYAETGQPSLVIYETDL
jgi:4-amino-4-deoxy-L-arabinose transferase-like glycosyltransferase